MENIKVASVNNDSVVSIQVSGEFYYRLQALFVYMSKDLSQERISEILSLMKQNNTSNDVEAYNIETIVSLLCTIENRFKEEDMIVMKDYSPIHD